MLYTHAAAALIAAALASAGTWRVQEWRHAAIEAHRVAAAQEARRNQERAAATAATTYEDRRHADAARIKTITVEVDRIIDRPVYRDRCFDDDGLRALTSAVTGAAPAASQPGRPLP